MYLSQILCCIFSNSDSKQEPHKFCSTRTYIPLYFLLLRLQGYEWVIGYLKSVYWARLNCKPTSIWGSFAFDSVTNQSAKLEYLALWVHVTRSYLAVSLWWRWDQKIRWVSHFLNVIVQIFCIIFTKLFSYYSLNFFDFVYLSDPYHLPL